MIYLDLMRGSSPHGPSSAHGVSRIARLTIRKMNVPGGAWAYEINEDGRTTRGILQDFEPESEGLDLVRAVLQDAFCAPAVE